MYNKEPKEKTMTKEEMTQFIGNVCRDEMNRNFSVYSKAIRATLIALGYNEDFVEDTFREEFERLNPTASEN